MYRYEIKQKPEDFIVNELPRININYMSGNIKYYLLIKKGISTFDAIDMVCKKYSLDKMSISYAGLKDEVGITTQYISIDKAFSIENAAILEKKNEFVYIRFIGYGESHIRKGKLCGNDFQIVLRKCDNQLSEKIKIGKYNLNIINYFDMQRFGLPDQKPVTHLVGKALVEKDLNNLEKYLKIGNQGLSSKEFLSDEQMAKQIFARTSWSSYLWNRELSDYITSTYYKDFYVQQLEETNDEFSFGFLNAQTNVLPLTKQAQPFEYYYESKGIIQTKTTNRDIFKKIVLDVEDISVDVEGDCQIKLCFTLDKGVYATMVVRQFIASFL